MFPAILPLTFGLAYPKGVEERPLFVNAPMPSIPLNLEQSGIGTHDMPEFHFYTVGRIVPGPSPPMPSAGRWAWSLLCVFSLLYFFGVNVRSGWFRSQIYKSNPSPRTRRSIRGRSLPHRRHLYAPYWRNTMPLATLGQVAKRLAWWLCEGYFLASAFFLFGAAFGSASTKAMQAS